MDSYLFVLLLTSIVWLEPGSCASLPRHDHSPSHRVERSTDEDTNFILQFDLATNTTAVCVDSVGSNVSVELSYRTPGGEWTNISSFTPGNCERSEEEVRLPQNVTSIQFRWRQREQAWGRCNCWQIDNVAITNNSESRLVPPIQSFSNFQADNMVSDIVLKSDFVCTHYGASADQLSCSIDQGLVFCQGSASVPRGVVTPMYDLLTGDIVSRPCTASDLYQPIGDIQLCRSDNTSGSLVNVSFQLTIHDNRGDGACEGIESFDEGVELAIRRSEDEQWVPLKFYTLSSLISMERELRIDIGRYNQNNSILSLRGYNVSVMLPEPFSTKYITEYICDERFFQDEVQFRWLQTVLRDDHPTRDTWFISDVVITVQNLTLGSSGIVFSDDFSDRRAINATLWPQVRGGQLGGAGTGVGTGPNCVPEDDVVLFFGANEEKLNSTVSRMAVTKPLNLVPGCTEECGVNAECTGTTGGCTTGAFVCTCRVGFKRFRNGMCISIESLEAVEMIEDIISNATNVPPSRTLSSLRSLLRKLSAKVNVPPVTSELLFDSVSDLIDRVQDSDGDEDDVDPAAIGSTLLDLMDIFALGPYDPEQGELEDTDNIALVHMVQGDDDSDEAVEGITRDGNAIMLPREVFTSFNMSNVPVASFHYNNLSSLLPDFLPNSNTTTMRLASPVLSSALQCGSTQCNTQDLNLTNPVVLLFNHSQELVNTLRCQDKKNHSMVCVFWDFDNSSTNELISGNWSTEGCTRNDMASNENQTVCECNHLTHFALLLSTTEIPLTPAEALSLRIIGIICVTISLVCLTATILTFLFLKSLWSMRNYVHINLCASLFVAQLTFIVAVEPHGSVAGCQAVAVLLHYFFLVTFMWMLMEGVVLYVALVRVFVKFKNRYLIAFTLASYGIPLLYLCITVPLGFALDNGPHYAGDDPQSCWLRYDTHFIWAFIAPVIVIILANIGFFIMAITIMYRHQRRQTHKSKLATFMHWLKASISLVAVMGITWIIGILVFNRDLLFVAYIYTIFIGLQGLVIFLIFVVLSKQVREAYTKWWKVKVASSDFLGRHFGEKSYAIHTASTHMGASTNKHSVPNDNSKPQGTHNFPSLDFSDSCHDDILHRKDSTVFDVTFIKEVTAYGVVPDPIGDVGGGAAEEREVEALAGAVTNGSALSLEGKGVWGEGENINGGIRTAELDKSDVSAL